MKRASEAELRATTAEKRAAIAEDQLSTRVDSTTAGNGTTLPSSEGPTDASLGAIDKGCSSTPDMVNNSLYMTQGRFLCILINVRGSRGTKQGGFLQLVKRLSGSSATPTLPTSHCLPCSSRTLITACMHARATRETCPPSFPTMRSATRPAPVLVLFPLGLGGKKLSLPNPEAIATSSRGL